MFFFYYLVSTLFKKRLQITSHVTKKKEIQEQDHLGIQNSGSWTSQYDTCKSTWHGTCKSIWHVNQHSNVSQHANQHNPCKSTQYMQVNVTWKST